LTTGKLPPEDYHTAPVVCSPADMQKEIMWFSQGLNMNKNKKKQDSHASKQTNKYTHTTWQSPDTPAIDSKLKARARKVSNEVASVSNFGGGPGTVGIAKTPES
jgi:hypothetical protein